MIKGVCVMIWLRLSFSRLIIVLNLKVMFSICGSVCCILKFVFDVISIRLFGLGVIEVMKVKVVSVRMMCCDMWMFFDEILVDYMLFCM